MMKLFWRQCALFAAAWLLAVPAIAQELQQIEALQDVLMVMSNGQVALHRIPFGLAQ